MLLVYEDVTLKKIEAKPYALSHFQHPIFLPLYHSLRQSTSVWFLICPVGCFWSKSLHLPARKI